MQKYVLVKENVMKLEVFILARQKIDHNREKGKKWSKEKEGMVEREKRED